MYRTVTLAAALAFLTSLCNQDAVGQKLGKGGGDDGGIAGAGIPSLDTIRVAGGGGGGGSLTKPVFVTAPPGDTSRLFIVEQRGNPSATQARIMILDLTTSPPSMMANPFLVVSGLLTGNEQGLLGMAFHPDYANNGFFWIDFTTPGGGGAGHEQITRYKVSANPNVADAASATPILSVNDPESNHNGGWLAFGPDGYLYYGIGDGGGANDQHGTFGNGQNISVLLGKILRIDVDGADNIPGNDDDDGIIGNGSTNGYTSPPSNPFFGITGNDEIWAYGIRNPWRDSFDRLTGQLYIADVGQDAWEEVDVQPANDPDAMPGDPTYQGGKNYGWRCMEANNCTGLTGCTCDLTCDGPPTPPLLTCPIHQYPHSAGRCSITGGYVYRGSAIPELQGTYFFADYCSNNIYTFQYTGTPFPTVTDRTSELAPGGGLSITSIVSFGEDANGEMYIVDENGGEVFKIVLTPPTNNACASASVAAVGSTPFNTAGATTDGPDETSACNFNGFTQITNDVWFMYPAQCTGYATIDVCNANFDSKLAVYGAACPTGPGQTLACDDNSCGQNAQVTIPVISGSVYRIRIGGVNGATGSGSLTISCTPTGACCMSDGTCQENLSSAACAAAKGTYQGDASSCFDIVCPIPCPGDTNQSGTVDVDDLLAVINAWGPCAPPCPADINGDGIVNVDDLLAVINAWGPCP